MAIKYIVGDLFSTKDKLIVHGCNSLGVMGGGVALIVRRKFPNVYEEYAKACEDDGMELGDVQFVAVPGKNLTVGNAITQKSVGSGVQVSYAGIRQCMKEVLVWCKANNVSSVSMPLIGAGLGGGDWDVIAKIIKDELRTINVNIWVLEEAQIPVVQ